ncbi:MAG: hypothetical protein ACU843_17275 [Gammaproteobacteria bacterium]
MRTRQILHRKMPFDSVDPERRKLAVPVRTAHPTSLQSFDGFSGQELLQRLIIELFEFMIEGQRDDFDHGPFRFQLYGDSSYSMKVRTTGIRLINPLVGVIPYITGVIVIKTLIRLWNKGYRVRFSPIT